MVLPLAWHRFVFQACTVLSQSFEFTPANLWISFSFWAPPSSLELCSTDSRHSSLPNSGSVFWSYRECWSTPTFPTISFCVLGAAFRLEPGAAVGLTFVYFLSSQESQSCASYCWVWKLLHHVICLVFLKRFVWCRPFLKSFLNWLQYCCCFMFWFSDCEACGILAPPQGMEPAPPALEGEVFTSPREIIYWWESKSDSWVDLFLIPLPWPDFLTYPLVTDF